MKRLMTIAALTLTFACAKEQTPAPSETSATPPPSSTTSAAEKTFQMKATIVSRDPAKNTVYLDNEAVPEMAAMKMNYEVRGAKVDSLPPNGTRVAVTVHEQNGKYSVTDVRPDQK